ncbi:MAG: PaaI family thioesterase [Rhodospirillales bacterium]|nr:PaaI family thioesterase [Rhodospirillales bacterium]MDH3910335.1 PaaI family thioesterase [Rhodospirillales bacterium]MDH3916813.1 PaaI family thioesterase [Rhodospirillales bacterium]MDH3967269.1 PaaI family thioesterase [Rhodospirillales bacterium]
MKDPLQPEGGFAALVGYRLGRWREDHAEILLDVAERHLNRSGVLHGGVLTTMIDAAGGYAGCHSAEPGVARRAFTLSLDCHFVTNAPAGSELIASARKTGGGRQIFFSTIEVHDQDGRLIAQGAGVYRYRGTGGA